MNMRTFKLRRFAFAAVAASSVLMGAIAITPATAGASTAEWPDAIQAGNVTTKYGEHVTVTWATRNGEQGFLATWSNYMYNGKIPIDSFALVQRIAPYPSYHVSQVDKIVIPVQLNRAASTTIFFPTVAGYKPALGYMYCGTATAGKGVLITENLDTIQSADFCLVYERPSAPTTQPKGFSITTSSIPTATVGKKLTSSGYHLTVAGATGTVTWRLQRPALAKFHGVVLTTIGILQGTPTAAGTSKLHLLARDSGGHQTTKVLTFVVKKE